MSNHIIEPLVFVDCEYIPTPPMLKRKIKFLNKMRRPLWQEQHQSEDSGMYSADDELEVEDIKVLPPSADVITKTEGLPCTSKNGICSECKLSRKFEKACRSAKNKCNQQ